jgi:hypothetical protein
MGRGLMYFCGRMTPRGMAIAIKMAKTEVTAKARMRSLSFPLQVSRFEGEWDLSGRDIVNWSMDCELPLSVEGFERWFTTMVDLGISRYGVPFFSPDDSGGSRYCVGVSLRWYIERRWLGGGMARPYAFEISRGDGLRGLGKTERGMSGVSADID